jgi:hypothetical protein
MLMAFTAADGSAVTPQIVIPRKSVDDDLFLTRLTPEQVMIRSQPREYVTTAIFDDLAYPCLASCTRKSSEHHIRVLFCPPQLESTTAS